MGYDLEQSMQRGIANSKVVVACVNSKYQSRPNCMFELTETIRMFPNKPIVTILTQSKPHEWATDQLKSLCNFEAKMYVDIGAIAAEQWDYRDDSQQQEDPDQLNRLAGAVQPLLKILEVDLQIHPSMAPTGR